MVYLSLFYLIFLSFFCAHFGFSKDIELRFKDGKFKILQLTDLHFGTDLDLMHNDKKTISLMEALIEDEKPDLVVVTGDAVSGWNAKKPFCCLDYGVAKCWSYIAEPFQKSSTPFAFAFGNHDRQGDLDTEGYLRVVTSYNMSVTKDAFYSLSILSEKEKEGCVGMKGWGCVTPDQVMKYRQLSQTNPKNNQLEVPAFAFMHIPLPEYMSVYNNFVTNGTRSEDICCQSVDTGLLAAFLESGNVEFVTAGHDHNDDFFGRFDNGIYLAYGRKTGFGCYGSLVHGGRVIELTLDNDKLKWSTWLRLENHKIDYQTVQHSPDPKDPSNQHICGGAIGSRVTYESCSSLNKECDFCH